MWHSRPPRDPPPFMANAILNFHFDFLNPSLRMDGKGVLFVTFQIFQDFQKGGRGDSKERQEGGVGHQGRRDGEVGTTNFEVHAVQEDVKT